MQLTRGGFGRRLGALFVDLVILTAIVQIAAMVLYPMTGGRVQASGLLRGVSCEELTAAPAGVALPPDLNANYFKDCRTGLFGLEHSHTLVAESRTEEAGETDTESWTVMLDKTGAPVSGPSLDLVILPLLMLWRIFADGRSAPTPGRSAMRLKVVAADDTPPGFGKAALRQLLLWGLVLAGLPLGLSSEWPQGIVPTDTGPAMILAMILGLAVFVWYIAAGIMIARRHDTLYDRWAGTAVVMRE